MKKNNLLIICLLAIMLLQISVYGYNSSNEKSSTFLDSINIMREYSLFSEYHKNRDYESAYPYGWNVINTNPTQFAKWIYYKMEEVLWYLRDSTDADEAKVAKLSDTTMYLYNNALEKFEEGRPYFQRRKALIVEHWYNDIDRAINEYETAVQMDSTVDTYWWNQLGNLYKSKIIDNEEYRMKAIDLYSYLSDREPNNPQWNGELENLVQNIEELIDIAKKAWDFNKEDLARAWKYAALCIKANDYKRAIEPLEFLVEKSPETINYWNQLATAYNRVEQPDKALEAYRRIVRIDPQSREAHLNIGIILKDKGQFANARTSFLKASEVAGGWGLAIFYEGLLYENAARNYGFDFMDKCVYQLAVDTYRRAASMDPGLGQARERISALQSSIPTKEDYFFRKYKSGQTIAMTGGCYGWIGKSITVP